MDEIENRKLVEEAKRNWMDTESSYIELSVMAAKQMRIYYDALLQAGFTSTQAITLLGHHGVDVGKYQALNNRRE